MTTLRLVRLRSIKKTIGRYIKGKYNALYGAHFRRVKDFTQYRGGLGYLFLESKVFELLSVYLSEVLELSILAVNLCCNFQK